MSHEDGRQKNEGVSRYLVSMSMGPREVVLSPEQHLRLQPYMADIQACAAQFGARLEQEMPELVLTELDKNPAVEHSVVIATAAFWSRWEVAEFAAIVAGGLTSEDAVLDKVVNELSPWFEQKYEGTKTAADYEAIFRAAYAEKFAADKE